MTSFPPLTAKPRLLAAGLGLTALLLAGCGNSESDTAQKGGDSPKAEESAEEKKGERPNKKKAEPVPVQVASVSRGPIAATLSFNSTLETESTVDLYPQVAGQVEELLVEEGDFVKAGDPLVRIDEREWRVDADEARVNLERTTAEFTRTQSLFERNLINQQEFEAAKFQLEQMRLRHERAKIRLDHATVRAPFDGVVSEREVQVGARVGNNTKLFSLVSLQDMVARVFVPGRYLPDLAAGQLAVITSEFLPDQEFEAWVKRISPVIDPQSGTFKVTVGVRNPDNNIVPGLFVRASIITEERAAALLLPKRAIVYDGGGQFVFTVDEEGQAKRLSLDAGFETADTIEIRSGLEEGDPVIVLGQSGLKDEAPVKVVNPELLSESAQAAQAARLAEADQAEDDGEES